MYCGGMDQNHARGSQVQPLKQEQLDQLTVVGRFQYVIDLKDTNNADPLQKLRTKLPNHKPDYYLRDF